MRTVVSFGERPPAAREFETKKIKMVPAFFFWDRQSVRTNLGCATLSSFVLITLLVTLYVVSALGRTLLSGIVSSVFLLARMFLVMPAGLVGRAGLVA
jgi:hypothetical protein